MQNIVNTIEEKLAELKLEDIKSYDIHEWSPLADFFIISSAGSMTQIDSARSKVDSVMSKEGFKLKNPTEPWSGGWLIMDYSDIVVNVFLEEKRSFYGLDGFLESGNIDLDEIRNAADGNVDSDEIENTVDENIDLDEIKNAVGG